MNMSQSSEVTHKNCAAIEFLQDNRHNMTMKKCSKISILPQYTRHSSFVVAFKETSVSFSGLEKVDCYRKPKLFMLKQFL